MNLPDQIPAAKRILALVDDYEQSPNVKTRSALRAAILDELEACAAQEREECAKLCDVTPPEPFRPSIEAAHAIRARGKVAAIRAGQPTGG